MKMIEDKGKDDLAEEMNKAEKGLQPSKFQVFDRILLFLQAQCSAQ